MRRSTDICTPQYTVCFPAGIPAGADNISEPLDIMDGFNSAQSLEEG